MAETMHHLPVLPLQDTDGLSGFCVGRKFSSIEMVIYAGVVCCEIVAS